MSGGVRLAKIGVGWVVLAGALRVTFLAPESCRPLRPGEATSAATAAADWIVANQGDSGRYLYQYDRAVAAVVDDYNVVRHAGTTMSLFQFVREGADRYLPAADRGLAWMLERLTPAGDGAGFATAGTNPRLGSAALLSVSLSQRRIATGDPVHDDAMRAVGRFMVGQQRADGSMLDEFDLTSGAPVPDETSLYSTGEALWALALLAEIFPDDGFGPVAERTLDYIATQRDADEDVFPAPWPDQWTSYALNEMAPWGLEDHHVDYAQRVAAQFGTMVRWEAQQGDGLSGRTHGPPASAAGQGTWLEGLGMLIEASLTDPRLAHLTEPMTERLLCSASRLVDKQVSGTGDPRLDGAFFTDDETRVDHQQHALSGLLFTERQLARVAGGSPTTED
jgi:hypothetical protein